MLVLTLTTSRNLPFSQQQAPCLICGQPLHRNGKHPAPVVAGPLCPHELGLLPTFLAAQGLSGFESGSQVFDAYLGSDGEGKDCWYMPQIFIELGARARRIGLKLEHRVNTKFDPYQVTAWLEIPKDRHARHTFVRVFTGWQREHQRKTQLAARRLGLAA